MSQNKRFAAVLVPPRPVSSSGMRGTRGSVIHKSRGVRKVVRGVAASDRVVAGEVRAGPKGRKVQRRPVITTNRTRTCPDGIEIENVVSPRPGRPFSLSPFARRESRAIGTFCEGTRSPRRDRREIGPSLWNTDFTDLSCQG